MKLCIVQKTVMQNVVFLKRISIYIEYKRGPENKPCWDVKFIGRRSHFD